MPITRQFWVLCHRWAGLTIALFLTVAGFTGIFLAWNDELESLIAPQLHVAQAPYPGAQPLDPLVLRARILAEHPGMRIDFVRPPRAPGETMAFYPTRYDPATGEVSDWSSEWGQMFVNPYTGRIQGVRQYADLSQGSRNLMPFIYRLHYTLALGEWGLFALGIAALIWTIDCFIGLYLTFPVKLRPVPGGRPTNMPGGPRLWWQRWRPSWSVRWGSSSYKLNFDLHRAGGLWIWPLLLVFAWSGVAFNIPKIYDPVMAQFGAENRRAGIERLAKPLYTPAMSMEVARARGAALASQEMARLGLEAFGMDTISYSAGSGTYSYRFRSSRDFIDRGAGSFVIFSAQDGRLQSVILPAGQNGANTFTNWIKALHMGTVFGLPWRIAISVIGAMVTMLSVTGVVIWTKKRSGRIARTARGGRRLAHG